MKEHEQCEVGQKQETALLERRRFLELGGKYGFATAVLAASAGTLFGPARAHAQSAREESMRKKEAKHTMTFATAYKLGSSRGYPLMQLDFKENVQNATSGQVYVNLAPAGQLGVGGALAKKVQQGTIQVAQHSLSNFAPFAPAVDLINLPYFCGANQSFVNLVTSSAWKREVDSKVEKKGFKPLWYVVIDPRTVGVRKGGKGPVRTPEDLRGIKFRVPGSKMLQQYYRLVGANPTPVAWGETPTAIKQGVADALDPALGGLWVFGFQDILSWVTFSKPVPDSQVYSCNLEWFSGLPRKVREGIEFASDITFRQNLAKVPSARNFAISEFRRAGVQFYTPTASELEQWERAGGYKRNEWSNFKSSLAGSTRVFNSLEQAANTRAAYIVHDT